MTLKTRMAHTFSRLICVAHGRTAMISEDIASAIIHSHRHVKPDKNIELEYDAFVAGALELYEITHHAAQSFLPLPQTSDAIRNDLLEPSPIEEKLARVLRTDGCLDRWEKSLPIHLRYADGGDHMRDDITTRQATILHLRYDTSESLCGRYG